MLILTFSDLLSCIVLSVRPNQIYLKYKMEFTDKLSACAALRTLAGRWLICKRSMAWFHSSYCLPFHLPLLICSLWRMDLYAHCHLKASRQPLNLTAGFDPTCPFLRIMISFVNILSLWNQHLSESRAPWELCALLCWVILKIKPWGYPRKSAPHGLQQLSIQDHRDSSKEWKIAWSEQGGREHHNMKSTNVHC